jgi:hypothetical protein
MARITWQNVTAPDLSTSRAALQQAGNSLSSGFQGFADSFKDIEQQQKDAYSQEALARLAQVSDPNQLNSMMASDGLAALGIEDPRYLNADVMQSILGRSKTLFDNQNTAANTANTQSTMYRRNRLLQGEVDQAAATLKGTEQTNENLKQTFDINEEKRPLTLKQLDAEINNINQQITASKNSDKRDTAEETRKQQEWNQELIEKQRQKQTIINDANIEAEIAAFGTTQAARDGWQPLINKVKASPQSYSTAMRDRVFGGADAAVGQRLSTAAETDAVAEANKYWTALKTSDNYTGSTRESLQQGVETDSTLSDAAKAKVREKINNIEDAYFQVTPVAQAAVSNNDTSLAPATNQSITEQKSQLTQRATQDPLHEFAKFWDGDPDSKVVGAAQKLRERLRDPEGTVFSGASNARVTRIIREATNELSSYNIPEDVIAYLVETGAGDEENMFGTRWLQGDIDVSKTLLKEAAIELFKPENRSLATQNYAAWNQEKTELDQIDAAVQSIIAQTEMKISQTSDKKKHPAIIEQMNKRLQDLGVTRSDNSTSDNSTPLNNTQTNVDNFRENARQNLSQPVQEIFP